MFHAGLADGFIYLFGIIAVLREALEACLRGSKINDGRADGAAEDGQCNRDEGTADRYAKQRISR